MAIDGSSLCSAGVPYPLAIEIGLQMTNGVGNADRLSMSGLSGTSAIELARQITSQNFSEELLARAAWNPITAKAIAQLGGGGAPVVKNTLQVSPGVDLWAAPNSPILVQ